MSNSADFPQPTAEWVAKFNAAAKAIERDYSDYSDALLRGQHKFLCEYIAEHSDDAVAAGKLVGLCRVMSSRGLFAL